MEAAGGIDWSLIDSLFARNMQHVVFQVGLNSYFISVCCTKRTKNSIIMCLPQIFVDLPPSDLAKCHRVCSQWRDFIEAEIWGKEKHVRWRREKCKVQKIIIITSTYMDSRRT